MADKVTAPGLRRYKSRAEKIVCVTAYDSTFAELADEAGVDLILVGDSVGNTMLGYSTTVPVTLAEMVHHTRAVRAGTKRALLVSDLPFGSYESGVAQALESAVALMKAGAEAVKIEGDYPEIVAAFVKAGIPVIGHLGMTPQSVHQLGGFRLQGKGDHGALIIEEAKRLAQSGVSALVLELVPAELAARITESVECPTIGIGAGVNCDGQVQVLHDMLGLSPLSFRHSKPFMDGRLMVKKALENYANEVRQQTFPAEENSF